GDNGDIIRIVGINGITTSPAAYQSFIYDNYGSVKIVVRVARLLDYTPGGPDFNAAGAATDIGGNDEIHGESGDDFAYGEKGSDTLFGGPQDDALLGTYGNDWIPGGTGSDGITGAAGRISTSRNSQSADPANAGYLVSLGEPLNGIAPLLSSDA